MKAWMGLFLFGVLAFATSEVKAADVGFSIGGGHHHGGASFDIHTGDSGYSNWYPSSNTYVYEQPAYVAPAPVYPTYRTETVDVYNNWYGDGRHYNHHDGHHDHHDDHHRH